MKTLHDRLTDIWNILYDKKGDYKAIEEVEAKIAKLKKNKEINDTLCLEGSQKIDEQRAKITSLKDKLETVNEISTKLRTRINHLINYNLNYQEQLAEAQKQINKIQDNHRLHGKRIKVYMSGATREEQQKLLKYLKNNYWDFKEF